MRVKAVAGVAVLGLTLAGCTGGSPAASSESSAASSSSTPPASVTPATDAQPVLVEAPFEGTTITLTVHPVEVRDGAAALTVDYEQADGDNTMLGAVLAGDHLFDLGATDLRLVDPREMTVSEVATRSDGSYAGTAASELWLKPDEPVTSRSFHAAPTGHTVDVFVPFLGYVRDVPVVQGGAGFDAAVEELGAPPAATPVDLRSYTLAFDDSSSAEVIGEQVTVTLTADVLFASSSAELTAEAAAVVDDTAAEIKARAVDGTVTVVGHTDDVDTEEFNQTLSLQRAQAVAARLEAALGGTSIAAEGRGESEPLVAGTSDEARAANRRVEITYQGTAAPDPVAVSAAQAPAATGPVVGGDGLLEYADYDTSDRRFSLAVADVERRGRLLVGTFELTMTAGSGTGLELMGKGVTDAGRRGFSLTDSIAGVMGVSLLTSDATVYPLDYDTPLPDADTPARNVLGDELINMGMGDPGQSVHVTVAWPDTGADAVTIDIPGRGRFEDVPVTE